MPAGNLGRTLPSPRVVVVLDRATKHYVVEVLDLANRLYIPVLDPWLNLTMAWNEGINFGLFDFGAAGRWVLVALALAIVVVLAVWARRGGWVQAVGAGVDHRRRARQRLGPAALRCGGRLHQHELLRHQQPLRLQPRRRGDLRRRGAAGAFVRPPGTRQQDVTGAAGAVETGGRMPEREMRAAGTLSPSRRSWHLPDAAAAWPAACAAPASAASPTSSWCCPPARSRCPRTLAALPPPKPGTVNRVDYRPHSEAIAGLTGRPAAATANGAALVAQAGPRDPQIRAELAPRT